MSDNVRRVKILLFGDAADTLQDDLLEEIEASTTDHFKAITGATEVPEELGFIIREVMVKRYNRLGNEGMSSTSRTDLSMTFTTGDFDDYLDILKKRFDTSAENKISPGRMLIL